jgi:hypothetical protein
MVSMNKVKNISRNIFDNLKNLKGQSRQIAELKAERIRLLEKLAENNNIIRSLKTALENNGEIISEHCAYWRKDDLGNITEGPFCMSCFITESALRPLVRASKPHNIDGEEWEWVQCSQCKAPFRQRRVGQYLLKH